MKEEKKIEKITWESAKIFEEIWAMVRNMMEIKFDVAIHNLPHKLSITYSVFLHMQKQHA